MLKEFSSSSCFFSAGISLRPRHEEGNPGAKSRSAAESFSGTLPPGTLFLGILFHGTFQAVLSPVQGTAVGLRRRKRSSGFTIKGSITQ